MCGDHRGFGEAAGQGLGGQEPGGDPEGPADRAGRCQRRYADFLKQAFNIHTVADLGRNKYFRAAQALWALGETTK